MLLTTGATKRNSILNIYDLAGNLEEYTLEFNYVDTHTSRSAVRGGNYCRDGMSWTIFNNGDVSYGACYNYVGFRITLIPN